jgi:hypothetical protein
MTTQTSRFCRASHLTHSAGRWRPEIDEVYDAEAAKNQLGHTSKTVTERHYINRKLVVPDYRAATERLAPGSGAGRVTGPAQ